MFNRNFLHYKDEINEENYYVFEFEDEDLWVGPGHTYAIVGAEVFIASSSSLLIVLIRKFLWNKRNLKFKWTLFEFYSSETSIYVFVYMMYACI